MASTTFDVSIRIDGTEHAATIVAHDSYVPADGAPAGVGDAPIRDMGRLFVTFAPEYSGPRSANADTGQIITLIHDTTETPCHSLAAVQGNRACDAYLLLEPDHYNEWRFITPS